jgi:hypothetical protein
LHWFQPAFVNQGICRSSVIILNPRTLWCITCRIDSDLFRNRTST